MTELEKCLNNRYADVDLNRMVVELAEFIETWGRKTEKRQSESPDFFEFSEKARLLSPALLSMCCFGTVLSRIGMSKRSLPILLGGIGALEKSLTEELDRKDRMAMIAFRELLANQITTVTLKIPVKKEGKES